MSSDHHHTGLSGEQISALLDGELDESLVGLACSAWRDQPAARSTWHAYHLIGDVMRSEDLASDAGRDAAFLQALRGRLALEPVVLAPSSAVAASAGRGSGAARETRRSWRTPAAVAAGFVVVAGALVVTREPTLQVPAEMGRQVAAAPVAAPSPVAVSLSATRPAVVVGGGTAGEAVPDPEFLVANGKLIRDAQLDRYLSAHKQFAGSSALGVPSAFLRSATADMSNR